VVRNLSSCLVFASQFFLPASCLYIFLGKYGVGFTEQLRLVIMCCEVTPSDQTSPVFVKVKQRLANHPGESSDFDGVPSDWNTSAEVPPERSMTQGKHQSSRR